MVASTDGGRAEKCYLPENGKNTARTVLVKFFVHLTLAIAPNETAQKVLSIELGGSSNGQF
jgi:hypothetical protein